MPPRQRVISAQRRCPRPRRASPRPRRLGGQPRRVRGAAASTETPAPEAEALDRDAKVFATLQELRQLLAQTESGPAGRVPDPGNPASRAQADGRHRKSDGRAAGRRALLSGPGGHPRLRASARAGAGRASASRRDRHRSRAPRCRARLLCIRTTSDGGSRADARRRGRSQRERRGCRGGLSREPRPASEAAPIPSAPAAAVPDGDARGRAEPTAAPAGCERCAELRAAAAGCDHRARASRRTPRAPDPAARRPGGVATSAVPAAAAGARPRAPESGTGIERPAPPRIGPCTDAVAALGLCTREPTQRRE